MSITDLGIDLGVIVAVGAISEAVKKAIIDERFKRFYVFIPLVVSALAAVSMASLSKEWAAVPITTIKYFGITSFGYSFIKKTLLRK